MGSWYLTVILEKGRGCFFLSHVFKILLGDASIVMGIIGTPVSLAMSSTPTFNFLVGPAGPSGLIMVL